MVIDSRQYNGLCTCGKDHRMETAFCIIEGGCLKNIDIYLKEYGLNGYTVAVYDENTYLATADRHPRVDAEVVLPAEDLHANEHGVQLLLERLPRQARCLIAVGSGTVHDIVRYCAYERGNDFVSCPTAASVDGFCSFVAAMTWHGCKKTLTAVAPKIVVADLDIIKSAPLRLARSGFGDMVGKYIALTDWKITHILTGEFYCHRIAQMTMDATGKVTNAVEGIVEGKAEAYQDLMYGLLLSGLAMQMIGNSRPASGAEHHISHFIEMRPLGMEVSFDALHGEKVGVGTLLVMEHYQRLLEHKAPEFCDYTGVSVEKLEKIFGEDRAQEIAAENRVDAANGITAEKLREKWQEVLSEISTLPKASAVCALYQKLEAKGELPEIGVSDDKKEFLLNYALLVRNRLTLLRLISRGAITFVSRIEEKA